METTDRNTPHAATRRQTDVYQSSKWACVPRAQPVMFYLAAGKKETEDLRRTIHNSTADPHGADRHSSGSKARSN